MKKIIVASALALTATVAVASTTINLKKVNKVIQSVIQPELTPLIKAVEIKFDERSNLENVQKLKTAVTASATARASKWSQYPTTLDIKAGLMTLNSDEKSTKMTVEGSLGSKTEAVSLYRYVSAYLAKESVQPGDEPQDPSDKEFQAWFEAAAQTKSLDAIPEQLEQLIAIMKKALLEDPAQTPNDVALAKLINSLKVDTRIQNFKTMEVILKTSEVVTIDDIVVSNLSFKISDKGLSLNGKVDFSLATEQVTQYLESTKGFLKTIETADAETLNSLRESAKSYIQLAESFVNGEDD